MSQPSPIIIVIIFDVLILSNSLKGSSNVFNYFVNIDEALLQFLLSSLWVYWHAASLVTGQGPFHNRVRLFLRVNHMFASIMCWSLQHQKSTEYLG